MGLTPEQLDAVRAWREDNPATTVPFEAFGVTWQIPASLSLDLILWQAELRAAGRSWDDLHDEDVQRFLVGVVGDDVLDAWRRAGLDAEEVSEAAGRAFAEKILRGRTSSGEAEAGAVSPSTTSSPTGSSSSPTSPESTPPNPFTAV